MANLLGTWNPVNPSGNDGSGYADAALRATAFAGNAFNNAINTIKSNMESSANNEAIKAYNAALAQGMTPDQARASALQNASAFTSASTLNDIMRNARNDIDTQIQQNIEHRTALDWQGQNDAAAINNQAAIAFRMRDTKAFNDIMANSKNLDPVAQKNLKFEDLVQQNLSDANKKQDLAKGALDMANTRQSMAERAEDRRYRLEAAPTNAMLLEAYLKRDPVLYNQALDRINSLSDGAKQYVNAKDLAEQAAQDAANQASLESTKLGNRAQVRAETEADRNQTDKSFLEEYTKLRDESGLNLNDPVNQPELMDLAYKAGQTVGIPKEEIGNTIARLKLKQPESIPHLSQAVVDTNAKRKGAEEYTKDTSAVDTAYTTDMTNAAQRATTIHNDDGTTTPIYSMSAVNDGLSPVTKTDIWHKRVDNILDAFNVTLSSTQRAKLNNAKTAQEFDSIIKKDIIPSLENDISHVDPTTGVSTSSVQMSQADLDTLKTLKFTDTGSGISLDKNSTGFSKHNALGSNIWNKLVQNNDTAETTYKAQSKDAKILALPSTIAKLAQSEEGLNKLPTLVNTPAYKQGQYNAKQQINKLRLVGDLGKLNKVIQDQPWTDGSSYKIIKDYLADGNRTGITFNDYLKEDDISQKKATNIINKAFKKIKQEKPNYDTDEILTAMVDVIDKKGSIKALEGIIEDTSSTLDTSLTVVHEHKVNYPAKLKEYTRLNRDLATYDLINQYNNSKAKAKSKNAKVFAKQALQSGLNNLYNTPIY